MKKWGEKLWRKCGERKNMSKIGKIPVIIPQGVTVEKTERKLVVNGPKGSLQIEFHPNVQVETIDDQIVVKRRDESKKSKALHGLTRNLIFNMVAGVTEGWSKKLELHGVGFRAQGGGDKLVLSVGFSHPVEINAPEGVQFQVSDNTKITVSGIDKQQVGQVAANIRDVRPPDAYKGKGVRYAGEYIKKKPGKSGKAGAAGGK